MSNVPKSKRSLSDLEFYRTAIRLRTVATGWLLRDFGIKDKVRDLSDVAKKYKMSDADTALLEGLFARYGLGDRVLESFPEWWIKERRRTIDNILSELVAEIRRANSIYPVSIPEYHERRLHQDRAIAQCDVLEEELHYVIDVLARTTGIELNKYAPFIELVEKERALLKGWRKSDNRILTRLKKGKEPEKKA